MKRFISLCLMLYFTIFTSSCVYAMGTATEYKIIVKEVQLLNDKGVWVTIATPNQEIDIASVAAAGDIAGSMVGNTNIPTGTYVNCKVVLSNVMKFAGTDLAIVYGSAGATKAGGTVTLTGNDQTAASTTTWLADPPVAQVDLTHVGSWQAAGNTPGEVTATLNLGAAKGYTSNIISSRGISDFTPPIEIKDSSKVSAFFQFDVTGTVGCALVALTPEMFFVPPEGGTSFGITVDGTTYAVIADNMRTDFNQ